MDTLCIKFQTLFVTFVCHYLERPGTYRKTDVENSTNEDASLQPKDKKSVPSKPGQGQATGKGKFGSKGGPTEGEALPVGDESLPWRQKRKQVTHVVEKQEKTQEIEFQQQAQPWTQEKVTLRKTTREKKELKKETIEEVSLKPTKPKEKDIPKSELEKVDLRHTTEEKELTTISKEQISADKVKHVEDATLLKVDESEKTNLQQQSTTVKDWRKKRMDTKQVETEEGLSKQRQLEDTTILQIDEVSKKDVVDKTEARGWRKPREDKELQPQQTTDEQVVPWTKQQIKLRKTSKERKETKEEQVVDQSLIKEQHLVDTNLIRVDERETETVEQTGVIKDWRKSRKPSEKTEREIKPKKSTSEDSEIGPTKTQTVPQTLKEEPLPWNKQEIKLKSVTKTQKEAVKETIEDVQLKPVKKPEKQEVTVQKHTDDSTLIRVAEKETTETTERTTTKDWRKSRKTVQKPEKPTTAEQKQIEDTTLLTIEQREDKDVQDSLTTKDWRKARKPSEKLEETIVEQLPQVPDTGTEDTKGILPTSAKQTPQKLTDKPQQPTKIEEPIPWNQQEIKLKSTVRDKKEIVTEKIEEVQLKPIKKFEKETVLEQSQIEDTTLLRIDEKQKEDFTDETAVRAWRKPQKPIEDSKQPIEQTQINDVIQTEENIEEDNKIEVVKKTWRKPRKPSDKPEQTVVVEQKQVDETTLLNTAQLEKQDIPDKTEVKDWRKPRKESEIPKQPTDQETVKQKDEKVQDTKPRKPTEKPQEGFKEEPVPWNKQEIKLKSTVRDKKEIVTEKIEVQLNPVKKVEKETEDSTITHPTEQEVTEQPKTKDLKKPRKPSDKPEQTGVVEQTVEDTTLLHIDEKEKEDVVDTAEIKGWRKPRKPTEIPKQSTDQILTEDLEQVERTTQDIKPRKTTDKQQQPASKEESVPWNKQEIKLKSTVRDKKETVTENIEEVQLKPIKKTKTETVLEQEQTEDLTVAPVEKQEITEMSSTDRKKTRKLTEKREKIAKVEQKHVEDTILLHVDEKEKENVTEQPVVKDWRKPRKPTDKPEKPATLELKHVEQNRVEDTTLLHVDEKEKEDVTEKPAIKDWRKPRKPTDQTEQPVPKEEPLPLSKQEVKLKRIVPTKKEEAKEAPVQEQTPLNAEDAIKPATTDVKKPKEIVEQPQQQKHEEDIALLRTDETEKVVEEEIPTRAWRKPRKLSEQPSDQKLPTAETVVSTEEEIQVVKEKISDKPVGKVELSEAPEEQIPWNKQDIKLKRTVKHKKEQVTEKIEDVQLKPLQKPEKPKPHEKQQTEDSTLIDVTEDKQTKLHKESDRPEQPIKEERAEDVVLLRTDEKQKKDVKDQIVSKDWRKPRKPSEEATQPIQKEEDQIPTKVVEDQIAADNVGESISKKDVQTKSWRKPRQKDVETPETQTTEPLTITATSEIQPEEAEKETVIQKHKIHKKVKVTKDEEETVKEEIPEKKPETKLEEKVPKEITEKVPWTQEKIQLKKTVRDKKVTQKEGLEEVELKPVIPQKPEIEQVEVTKPEKEDSGKSEDVQEEITTQVTRKMKTKAKPKEHPETVVLEETVTEVEDTVVLKVDEQPDRVQTTTTEDSIQEQERKGVPWRRQKQVKVQETEDIEKIQLKRVQKVAKPDKKEKEDVKLKPVPQKEDKVEPDTAKPIHEDTLRKELPDTLPSEEVLPLEKPVKPAEVEDILPEQQVISTPWRKQHKVKTDEIPDEKPKLKIGKGKIPEDKEDVEKVTLKPIPRKTKDVEDKKSKPESELVPIKLEETKMDEDIPTEFAKKTTVKLTKPEVDSQKEEIVAEVKPEDEAEDTLPQKEIKVDIKSKKTVKEQRPADYYDDDRPLPELEIISQKRTVQGVDKAPEEEVEETKVIHDEIITIKSQKKRQIQKAKPKPPKFVQRLEPVAAEKNRPARLICKVEGLPFPEVAWYKNETLLQPSERVTVNVTEDIITLEFASVQPQDVAIYSCKAINPAGVATSTANLVILGTNFLLCVFVFVPVSLYMCFCVLSILLAD